MQFTDPVYGSFDVRDGVLIDLVNSKPMERIKHISQQGIPKEFDFKNAINHGRYEHCVGVMLLLRKLNASLEEQVSGLLHDVSHTAFSHTADMILGSYAEQGLQDSLHEEYFKSGELSDILERYGYDPKRISNEKLFGLLERDIPDICADRVDYSLRGRYYQGGMESVDIAKHIIPYNNEMILDSGKYALEYGKLYLHMQKGEYGNVDNIAIRYAFATAIKTAFEAKAITKDELLYGTDDIVVQKAENAGIEYVNKVFEALRNGQFSVISNGGIHLKAKPRYVDPKFLDNGILRRASETDKGFRDLLKKSKAEDDNGHMVSIRIGDMTLG